jgi:hypothetical protein
MKKQHAVEAMVGSLGILLFGFLSLPALAWLVGGSLTTGHGAVIGVILFVLRFLWLWAVRTAFSRFLERAP